MKADPDKAAALGESEDIGKSTAMNALIAQELAAKKGHDHGFDIAKMTSFQSNTGPHLQYWHAKICSLLKEQGVSPSLTEENVDSIADEDPANLVRVLAQYPSIIHTAFENLEPAGIMEYLFAVTDQISTCLDSEPDEPNASTMDPAQAALYDATRIVLENGMKILRIKPTKLSS